MMKMTDHECISAIRERNNKLTSKVYNLYRDDFIYKFRKWLGRNEDDIFDIYQEAFLELCDKIYTNKINEISLTSSLKTYLYAIGKYIVIATYRKNQKSVPTISDIPDIAEDDSELEEDNEKVVQLAVEQMGEPCYSILTKQYWDEESGEAIAIALNYKNVDTVKTQKYKCIQKLKKDLKDKIIYLN